MQENTPTKKMREGAYMPEIRFELIEDGFLPTAAMPGDAGHDVRACLRPDENNEKYMQMQDNISRFLQFLEKLDRSLVAWNGLPTIHIDGNRIGKQDEAAAIEGLKMKAKYKELLLLVPPHWHEIENRLFGYNLQFGESSLGLSNWFLVPLGFKVQLPDHHPQGPFVYVMDIVSRSGLGTKHGLVIKQGEGTVDSGYRDEVKAPLENKGNGLQFITKGARIAQAKIYPCLSLAKYETEELIVQKVNETARGTGGYGHTGT